MSNFSNLEFGPHPEIEGGIIARKEFDNGYGIVVERCYVTDERGAILHYTLGADEGLYQISFTKDGETFFGDPVPDNYVGAASEEVVTKFMNKIEQIAPTLVFTDDDEDEVEIEDGTDVMDFRHGDTFMRGASMGPIEL